MATTRPGTNGAVSTVPDFQQQPQRRFWCELGAAPEVRAASCYNVSELPIHADEYNSRSSLPTSPGSVDLTAERIAEIWQVPITSRPFVFYPCR